VSCKNDKENSGTFCCQGCLIAKTQLHFLFPQKNNLLRKELKKNHKENCSCCNLPTHNETQCYKFKGMELAERNDWLRHSSSNKGERFSRVPKGNGDMQATKRD